MTVTLPPGAREVLRPLFAGFRPLHGAWEAALAGPYGAAIADDARHPSVARVTLDFEFLAGDPAHPAASELLAGVRAPAELIAPAAWHPLIEAAFAGRLRGFERVVFANPAAWDRARLRALAGALPSGFTLARVDASSVAAFRALAPALVYNFASDEAFLREGVGFGVFAGTRAVAGCSSGAIGGGVVEFEIQAHADYRRRGLATAAGARLVEHCLDHGLEPAWDAHNPPSAALAARIGFVDPMPYRAFDLRD